MRRKSINQETECVHMTSYHAELKTNLEESLKTSRIIKKE